MLGFIQMFLQEASLRLYSLPQKEKEKKEKNDEEAEGMVTLCVHFCFGNVYRLCSLPQNQTELLSTLRQAWT